MLDYAWFRRDELTAAARRVLVPSAFLGKYKYLHLFPYHDFDSFRVEPISRNKIQMVSVSDGGEILGYFGADVDRDAGFIKELMIFAVADRSATFSSDFRDFVRKLLLGYNFSKMMYTCVVGSPQERMYDRYTEKYGGRIVGILKNHVKLIDGKIYDIKLYEFTRDGFNKTKRTGDARKTEWKKD